MSGLTTGQVARRLQISESRVVQLAREGKIEHEMTPLGRLYDADDVERLAAERQRQRAAGEVAEATG